MDKLAVQLGQLQAQLTEVDKKVTRIEVQGRSNNDRVIELCTRVEILVAHYEASEGQRAENHNGLLKIQGRVNIMWFLGGGLLLAVVLDIGTRIVQLIP